MAASRPPESRRLRRPPAGPLYLTSRRLTPPGIAATAATFRVVTLGAEPPPQAPRNRGDCGDERSADAYAIPAASRPPESRRLRPGGGRPGGRDRTSPHAPRNRGDCGRSACLKIARQFHRLTPPGIAATAAPHATRGLPRPCPASRPPESRRLRPLLLFEFQHEQSASRPPESRRLRLSSMG